MRMTTPGIKVAINDISFRVSVAVDPGLTGARPLFLISSHYIFGSTVTHSIVCSVRRNEGHDKNNDFSFCARFFCYGDCSSRHSTPKHHWNG